MSTRSNLPGARAARARTACRLVVLTLWAATPCWAQAVRPSDYVNTLRGSDSSQTYSHGNTFPAVAVPFGFNFWTPLTDANTRGWLYQYDRPTLQGFAVSHQPSPWIGDYGSVQVMPSVGPIALGGSERAAPFRHANEVARAHYYRVSFDDSGLTTEIAPSDHGAVFRFTYPRAKQANLLFDSIDDAHGVMTADRAARSVEGFSELDAKRLYFYATLDRPLTGTSDPAGGGVNLAVTFSLGDDHVATLRIATSFISVEQARANLEQEIASKSFDEVRNEAQAVWDGLLGKIELEGASDAERVTFYSSLYRAFLYPNSRSELVDNERRHHSPYLNAVRPGGLYVNNGFWDTYRALWPLDTLLIPNLTGQMLDGFVTAYKEAGWIPRWSGPDSLAVMLGTHADIVLADAYLKGVRGFDAAAAYESMLKNALVYSADPRHGRAGNARSIFRGYIPLEDSGESAAWHLEDCVNDFGIARMAQALGDAPHARYFRQRALAYTNLFSPTTGFFRGRAANGRFRTSDAEFHPNEWGFEYVEGSAWHYLAAASHDPLGIASLHGGTGALARMLDAMLAAPVDFMTGSFGTTIHEMVEARDVGMGQYAHPNEPVHHMLYMYDYLGEPSKTQRWVRTVLDPNKHLYGDGLSDGRGYLGDEDNGQMSAWYVFSALGFYPAAPGQAEYAIGSPLYRGATLHLENGHDFRVIARDNAADHPYVQSARLNGVPYDKSFLSHDDILRGGELELQMGGQPSTWATSERSRPSSLTQPGQVVRPARDCARGGRSRSSGDTLQNREGSYQAFDDDSGTKWLASGATAELEYDLPEYAACDVDLYTLTSGGDAPDRDPQDWSLEGSLDGRSWQLLDQRTGEHFRWRRQTRVFSSHDHTPYTRYRLRIARNHGAPLTQLSEVELLATPDPIARPARARSKSAYCALTHPGGSADPHACLVLTALGLWSLRRGRRARIALVTPREQ
jgi:predicted alpha-1,2-mannosidase